MLLACLLLQWILPEDIAYVPWYSFECILRMVLAHLLCLLYLSIGLRRIGPKGKPSSKRVSQRWLQIRILCIFPQFLEVLKLKSRKNSTAETGWRTWKVVALNRFWDISSFFLFLHFAFRCLPRLLCLVVTADAPAAFQLLPEFCIRRLRHLHTQSWS